MKPENSVRNLSATDRAALIEIAREQAQRELARDTIGRRGGNGPVRASFSQERLWFLHQLDPESPVYNVPVGLRIDGPVDVAALKASLLEMVRRHDALRTTFRVVDGVPFQAVSSDAAIDLPIVDFQGIAEESRLGATARIAAAEARRPFTLTEGPLFRATLVRCSADAHALVLVMHHIISDGWSFAILVRELAAKYDALVAGYPASLPPLPVQYTDFSCWQRERLAGDALAQLLDFWSEKLGGTLPVLVWPGGRSRAATRHTMAAGARVAFEVPMGVSHSLQRFSQAYGVTLFATLLAVFKVLLCRYTGETDIIVGSPVANRMNSELDGVIGFFANTIVLRTKIDGTRSFRELAADVGATVFEAVAHEDLPFERLVEAIQIDRDLSRNPVFQTMMVHQSPLPPLHLSRLDVAIWDLDSGTSKFDLTLNTWLENGAIRGYFEYPTDLFGEADVRRMANHFVSLMASVIADPNRPVEHASLLTSAEQHCAVHEWNHTYAPYPGDRCLHQLIEEQVARHPDAVAVISGDAQWTYLEVDRRANQLAHYLRSRGVGPDVPVGLYLERSIHVPVCILAVLKAGGAYLPLDTNYPPDRLAFMLADARAPVVITSGQTRQFGADVHVIDLESCADRISRERPSAPGTDVRPDNLAYVIYTSGSTGTPKGVLLNHRGRVNNFTDFNRRFSVGAGDKVLAVSSLSFDMSAYDVIGILAAGATVVLPTMAHALDLSHWVKSMSECRITIWHSAPALMEAILDESERVGARAAASLRCVLLGGDWIPVSLPDRLRALVPSAVIVSLGGATEASMDSIIHIVETVDYGRRSIPYGRPLANQLAYVVATDFRPAPVGVTGELYLGGVGIGYGYLNRAALTAAKFVPNPFSNVPGDRLYGTGDLARYLVDGTIELIGRKDLQVKVRGVRIELEEIADALRRHPDIREAAVTTADEKGSRHLVAHVVTDSETFPPELQVFLKQRLPESMIPSIVVPWPALPLTPNGKIDRRALAAAPLPAATPGPVPIVPRSAVEKVVASVWLDVLSIATASVTDNFFVLRGHSLLATRVVSQLSEYFGIDLPLRAMFEAPTIGELAARVGRECHAADIDAERVAQVLIEIADLSDEQVALRLDAEEGGTA